MTDTPPIPTYAVAMSKTPDPKIDYGALNQPFLADLKLMGMKGI